MRNRHHKTPPGDADEGNDTAGRLQQVAWDSTLLIIQHCIIIHLHEGIVMHNI